MLIISCSCQKWSIGMKCRVSKFVIQLHSCLIFQYYTKIIQVFVNWPQIYSLKLHTTSPFHIHVCTLYFHCAMVRSDLYLPSKQLCPVRSFGQVHMYDPRVLRQVPLYMQGFRRHSSTSNIYIITEHVTCVSIYQNILCIFFFIFSILLKKICSKEYSWFLLKSSFPFFF